MPTFSFILLLLQCVWIGQILGDKKKGQPAADLNLGDMLGGLDLDGMLSGMQEMLDKAGKDGKKSGAGGGMDFDRLKGMLSGVDMEAVKNMLGQLDPKQISEALQGMVTPENVLAMVPDNLKGMMPESWFHMGKKLGNVLAKEWDKIAEVVKGADKLGSMEELWEMLKKKAPILADLLENDVWKGTKQRWEKFDGALNEEAKQYTENVKSSAWGWLTRKVLAPGLRLSPEAKGNMKESLEGTFPALKPLIEKAAGNEKLKQWAEQWQMMAELESMFAQMQSNMENLKNDGEKMNKTDDEEQGEEVKEDKDEL